MLNTPAIKVFVNRKYLTDSKSKDELIEAYLLAVDCRPNDRIRFTCLLQSGGIWSGLPIEAMWCDRFNKIKFSKKRSTEILQPYSCLESPSFLYQYESIKHANLTVKGLGPANYLFTINYTGQGFAECPEQYKTHNVVVMANGQLGAFPNNYLLIDELWFTSKSDTSDYTRDTKFYFPGG